MKDKITQMARSIISGGFDPLHIGHVRLIAHAKKFAPVIVCLNSDDWLVRKKGLVFMSWEERAEILSNIVGVDQVIAFDDSDSTAIKALDAIRHQYPDAILYFANGGDRTENNVPEIQFCNYSKIDILWNIGGPKIQSSSDLTKKIINQ